MFRFFVNECHFLHPHPRRVGLRDRAKKSLKKLIWSRFKGLIIWWVISELNLRRLSAIFYELFCPLLLDNCSFENDQFYRCFSTQNFRVYEEKTSSKDCLFRRFSWNMSLDSLSNSVSGLGVFPRKAFSIAAPEDCHVQMVTVYLHAFNPESMDQRIKVDFHKRATTEELIEKILDEKRAGTWIKKSKTEGFKIWLT